MGRGSFFDLLYSLPPYPPKASLLSSEKVQNGSGTEKTPSGEAPPPPPPLPEGGCSPPPPPPLPVEHTPPSTGQRRSSSSTGSKSFSLRTLTQNLCSRRAVLEAVLGANSAMKNTGSLSTHSYFKKSVLMTGPHSP